MIAVFLLLLIFISIVLGFKLGQLWYLDNYKACACKKGNVQLSVEPPAIVTGQTVYMADRDYWKEKG